MLRSLFGVAFPLFTTDMYARLGNNWASSVPAFLALACVPFPFVFYKYGARVRKSCKFAAEAQAFLERLRDEAQNDSGDSSGEGDDDEASTLANDESPTKEQARSDEATRHHNSESREAHLEAEALDFSYGPEENQPEYAAIKTPAQHRKSNPNLHRTRSGTYEANPFDIDRVNTNESFGVSRSNSRASSRARSAKNSYLNLKKK